MIGNVANTTVVAEAQNTLESSNEWHLPGGPDRKFAARRDQSLPDRIEPWPKRGGKRLRDDHCVVVCFLKWESVAPQERNAEAAEVIRRDSSQHCTVRFGLSLIGETKFGPSGGLSKGVGREKENFRKMSEALTS